MGLSELWQAPSPASAGRSRPLLTRPHLHVGRCQKLPPSCAVRSSLTKCSPPPPPKKKRLRRHIHLGGWNPLWESNNAISILQALRSPIRKRPVCFTGHLPGVRCSPKALYKVLLWPRRSLSDSVTKKGIRDKPAPYPPGHPLGLSWPESWAGRPVSLTPMGPSLCPPSVQGTVYLATGLGCTAQARPLSGGRWVLSPILVRPRGRAPVSSTHPPLAALSGLEVVEAWAAAATVPSSHMRQAGALASHWVTGSLLTD